MSSDETHYGSPPPLPDGVELRLYSMEYCPFAERSRIALAFKGVKHDIINCNLKDKPAFLVEANPNGTVPVLLHKGGILFESDIICEYLDGAFPDLPQLYPKDPMERAKARQLSANQCGKLIGQFYKSVGVLREGREMTQDEKDAIQKPLQQWVEAKLGDDGFLFGETISFVDVLVWPWLHRLETACRKLNLGALPADMFPRLLKYIERMREQKCIRDISYNEAGFLQFTQAIIKQQQPYPYNALSKHPMYASKPQE